MSIETELYTILKSVEGMCYGPELITNGSFDTADNWDFSDPYWEHIPVAEKVAAFSCSDADKYGDFSQESIGTESGKTYRCTYTLSGMDNVSLWIGLKNTSDPTEAKSAERTSNGSYSDDLVDEGRNKIWVWAYSETDTLSTAYIDDISLKEVYDICRVFPNVIPQDTDLPAIVYQQITGIFGYTADGEDTLNPYTYQITCWAESYSGARDLATKAKTALSAYEGGNIDVIYVTDEGDMPSLEGDVIRFGKRIDVKIWFNN